MNKNQPFLPFSAPSIGQQEIDAVTQVLRSGWITTGPRASELEQAYCQLTGCQHAVALYSATAGMHLALHAMDFKPGDEVITAWIALDDVDEENGCLRYINGSHRGGILPHVPIPGEPHNKAPVASDIDLKVLQ